MRSFIAIAIALPAAMLGAGGAADAQTRQYGAQVGNSYLPSTQDSNCGGLLCSSLPPRDPAHPSQPLPPPPCGGLLCSLTPYSMAPPNTGGEAERQRLAAPAASMPAPVQPAAPARHVKKRHSKAHVVAATAPRTPAPAEPAQ